MLIREQAVECSAVRRPVSLLWVVPCHDEVQPTFKSLQPCLFAVWMSSRQTRPGLLLLFACAHSALRAVDDVGRVYCAYPATTPAYVLLYSLSCCFHDSTLLACSIAVAGFGFLAEKASERARLSPRLSWYSVYVCSVPSRQAGSFTPSTPCN